MLCWSLEPTCANDFGSPFSGTPGDKRISGDQVTQGALGGLRDADARGDDYAVDTIAVIDDAEIGARAGQDLSVVALACDSQGFRQAAGAGGDFLARRKSLDFGPYFYPLAFAISSRPATGSRARNRTPPGTPSGRQETFRQ